MTSYQWYRNNTAVSGQTSATLTLPNVTTASAGSYVVVVTGSASLTSTPFSLTVSGLSPDYQPLVDLYNTTNGPGWTNNTGWTEWLRPLHGQQGQPWFGVTCSNGRVTRLDLPTNNLSGTLPSSLSALTNLTQLFLINNQLSGSIPSSLSALTNLQNLILSNNQLSGSIPSSLDTAYQLELAVLDQQSV